uniref:Uncharacterized protein n=1 Tax=Ornithorhynchus anatinus TaxID=9258 RepID=A0A6I8PBL4_ORNAN
MFPELNNLLDAAPGKPEEGKLTLLCDVKTDGSFLVHHFLSFYLRAGCKVCFVALLQSFSHYNIVAQKLVRSWGYLPSLLLGVGWGGRGRGPSGPALLRCSARSECSINPTERRKEGRSGMAPYFF